MELDLHGREVKGIAEVTSVIASGKAFWEIRYDTESHLLTAEPHSDIGPFAPVVEGSVIRVCVCLRPISAQSIADILDKRLRFMEGAN